MALFNDKYISGLKTKDKDYFEREDKSERKGGRIAVRVFPNGTKHFYFIYYFGGKRKLLAIGEYGKPSQGKMALSEAREHYAQLARMLESNQDPKLVISAEKSQKQEEAEAKEREAERIRLQGSLAQLVDFYLAYLKNNAGVNRRAKLSRVLGKRALKSFHPRLFNDRLFAGDSWSDRRGRSCRNSAVAFCGESDRQRVGQTIQIIPPHHP